MKQDKQEFRVYLVSQDNLVTTVFKEFEDREDHKELRVTLDQPGNPVKRVH